MQIEKALINDHLQKFQKYPENFCSIYNFAVIYG